MLHFLLVGLGGAIGSMVRHAVGLLSLRVWGPDFPWGTMAVNIAGSFAIGVIAGYLSTLNAASHEMRLFAVVGILGGFTTFSAFSLDAILLFERGNIMQAALYVLGSVVVSVVAAAIGLWVMRGVAA